VFLVDLDGLRRFPWISPRRAGRDLERLLHWTRASQAEQFRFLLTYCQARGRAMDPRGILRFVQAPLRT